MQLNDRQLLKLHDACVEYVGNRRWPTLVSRTYDSTEPDSMRAFTEELFGHVIGVLEQL